MEAEAASTSKFQIQRMASMSSMSESDISPAGDENIEDEIKEEITSDDEDERIWAALSFVIILIVFGVPLWWKMTEVERSYFPYDEISDLRLQNVTFPFTISINTVNPPLAEKIKNDLSRRFSSSVLFSVNFKITSLPEELKNKTIYDLEENLHFHPDRTNFVQLVETVFIHDDNIIIGKHRTVYFKTETSADEIFTFLQEVILHENLLTESIKAVLRPGYTSENLHYLRKIRPNPKYDIIFTVVNPEPQNVKFEWDNEIILEHFFRPLLNKLKHLSEFKIKSQWLYLVNLQQVPKKVDESYELNHKQIPHIITPLEKKIGSGVAKNPCINFVLYVTKCEHTPMVFIDSRQKPTSAVLSARWGGVQLVNPNSTHCVEKQPLRANSKKVMKIFLAQFKTLLGLRDFSFSPKVIHSDTEIHIYPWEIDALYRMRILEQFISSRITLTSLSQLLGEISNIVITDEVGSAVLEAANAVKETLKMLQDGLLVEALNFSTRSFISSEFAFTHPSLLALLYFPDDQKYAVYIPLYLPVMIPVLLSFKNMYKWLKKKLSRSKKDKKE